MIWMVSDDPILGVVTGGHGVVSGFTQEVSRPMIFA
jgi:hypothetical protein